MKRTMVLLATAAVSSSTWAVPPHLPDLVSEGNRWLITAYFDAQPGHTEAATQVLCFFPAGTVGTHQNYFWVSTSYPDWNGRAAQEGDQVFMHGDFQWPFGKGEGGHDSMDWEIVTSTAQRTEGTGHWKEWIEDGRLGSTVGFGNAKFTHAGKCDQQSVAEALEFSRQLRVPTDDSGRLLSPTGPAPDSLLEQ
jgi:hypothetical protein